MIYIIIVNKLVINNDKRQRQSYFIVILHCIMLLLCNIQVRQLKSVKRNSASCKCGESLIIFGVANQDIMTPVICVV